MHCPEFASMTEEEDGMAHFLIRASNEDDIGDITRIYGHHVLHGSATFEVDPPGQEEMAKRRFDIETLGLPYLVAELAGKVAGYAYASAYRPRAAYRFTVEDSIYVDPEHIGN